MSEAEKMESVVSNIKDTYETESKEDSELKNPEESLNESSDFQLVDSCEESLNKSENNIVISEENEETCTKLYQDTSPAKKDLVDTEKIANKVNEKGIAEMDEVSELIEKEKDNNVNLKSNDKVDLQQEDDTVNSTTIIHTIEKCSTKRKADSTVEPACKLLRMSSSEDALTKEKDKLDNDNSCVSPKSENSPLAFVIEETQDIVEKESFQLSPESPKSTVKESKSDSSSKSEDTQESPAQNENIAKESNKTLNNSMETNQGDVSNNSMECNEPISIATTLTNSEEESSSKDTVTKSEDGNVIQEVTECTMDTKLTSVEKEQKSNLSETASRCLDSTKNEKASNTDEKEEDETKLIVAAEDTEVNVQSKSTFTPETTTGNQAQVIPKVTSTNTSRMSVEVIFDKAKTPQVKKSKPMELVEIDEDGEKIILDSSSENSIDKPSEKIDITNAETTYKSCLDSKSSSEISYKSLKSSKESSGDSKSDRNHVNGSNESKKCDTDGTASIESDIFTNEVHPALLRDNISRSLHKEAKTPTSASKDSDNVDLLSVSDNEHDVSIMDDNIKNKSDLTNANLLAKALQVEKEIGVYVRLKCLLHIDESTKEFLSKELTNVHCEPMIELPSVRQKTEDTSASLADISGNDNKDSSPGSVNSNPQLFHLNPSRLSFLSTISSTSSASSAASLVAKLAAKDTHFSLPRGPAKHAKKSSFDMPSATNKLGIDESYERLTKEWKNNRLLVTTILSYLNAELGATDTYNLSNERLDDVLQKIRCSTPEEQGETTLQTTTPKSSRKGRVSKRPRSKNTRTNMQSNGVCKVSKDFISTPGSSEVHSRKKSKVDSADDGTQSSNVAPLKDITQVAINDELVGKEVFAKWSDNNYYPGTVAEKVKTKYKVSFYDGKNKVLIEDFIIPIPKTLKEGLSVYATTAEDDFGSCGIIVNTEETNDGIYYLVETDEGTKLRVEVKDIFLSADQAQVLKEETVLKTNSLPCTPKHLSQITLDNMVDGKRRSKRIATPSFSTPKSKGRSNSTVDKTVGTIAEPSVSGILSRVKKESIVSSENESKSSDSGMSIKDEVALTGVQPEIVGTPNEQIVKGPQHRIKSKPRSKKKSENEEIIATLGPIPDSKATFFEGMSFILTCAPLEILDRYQEENKDSGSETGTENEEEWVRRPFVRDRLRNQIEAAKGKVYDEFEFIPKEEYENTKLITNVPNTTAKSLLCLSVGIPAYNHNWIVQCCQEGKLINPAGWSLPVGWSLSKQSYIEVFQRSNNKPLTQVIVIIPVIETDKKFAPFWRQVCENAGAVVLLVDGPGNMEGFAEGTVVVTNRRCPSWAVTRANELQIPLLSTTWVIQCLIEGRICQHDLQERYKYNYIQK